jgi:hypothetical protein
MGNYLINLQPYAQKLYKDVRIRELNEFGSFA